jgi:1,4-dihydroxy-2-naphthoyl-CoA hydrolase
MTSRIIWFGGKRPALGLHKPLHEGTLHHLLGIEVAEVGDDFLCLRMPVDERTRQPFGRLHGGASVALAETAGSMAAGFCVDWSVSAVVGLEINANHVRPAHAGWVYATARPEAIGRTTQVWSIHIVDDAGKLVCTARHTVMVIAKDRR